MTKLHRYLLPTIAIVATTATLSSCGGSDNDGHRQFTKYERNTIKDGIKAYQDSNYQAADVAFEKVMAKNPDNEFAGYNSALTRMQSASINSQNQIDSLLTQVDSIFAAISATTVNDTIVRENSTYNRGNIAYNRQDYQNSIELYKQILRADTANRQALENLRLAQLKLQQQQQEQNDQDKDQDKDQDQEDQQQQQNQQQDQKDQQQDKDQNKDNQNQDQNQDQKDQQHPNNQSRNTDKQDQKPKDKQDGSISTANAKQILDAMEKKEAATRQRADAMKEEKERREATATATNKPW